MTVWITAPCVQWRECAALFRLLRSVPEVLSSWLERQSNSWTMALGCLCFTLTNQHRWKQELQPTRELGFHHNYRNFAIVDLHLCSYVLNSCFKHSTSCTGQFEHPPPRCYCSGLYSLLQNSRNAHSLYTYLIDSLSRREVLSGCCWVSKSKQSAKNALLGG